MLIVKMAIILTKNKKKCYSNKENGNFYKCYLSSDNVTCSICEEKYFLNSEDKKCSKIQGCAVSENQNICNKCDDDNCLDVSENKCVQNSFFNEDKKFYFRCNKTNDNGT